MPGLMPSIHPARYEYRWVAATRFLDCNCMSVVGSGRGLASDPQRSRGAAAAAQGDVGGARHVVVVRAALTGRCGVGV